METNVHTTRGSGIKCRKAFVEWADANFVDTEVDDNGVFLSGTAIDTGSAWEACEAHMMDEFTRILRRSEPFDVAPCGVCGELVICMPDGAITCSDCRKANTESVVSE